MRTLQIFAWVGLITILPFTVAAQRGGGWCTNNNYSKLFNPKTIVEIKGTIVSIDQITPEAGMSVGIHLMVKTEKNESISVHLGPSWYIDNQTIQFVVNDAIVVKGSRVTYQNAPAIIAMTATKGEEMLMLRDKNGRPNWNGWRKGKGGGKNGPTN